MIAYWPHSNTAVYSNSQQTTFQGLLAFAHDVRRDINAQNKVRSTLRRRQPTQPWHSGKTRLCGMPPLDRNFPKSSCRLQFAHSVSALDSFQSVKKCGRHAGKRDVIHHVKCNIWHCVDLISNVLISRYHTLLVNTDNIDNSRYTVKRPPGVTLLLL